MRATPVTFDVAFGSRSIRLGHDDPADRFIAATAMVHGLTLVTADRSLLAVSRHRGVARRVISPAVQPGVPRWLEHGRQITIHHGAANTSGVSQAADSPPCRSRPERAARPYSALNVRR